METPGCFCLFHDGNQWIAAGPRLVDLAACPSGRGRTFQEAIDDLTRQPKFQDWLCATGNSRPCLADFVVDDCAPDNLSRDISIAELVVGEAGNVIPLCTRRRAKA